MRPLRTLSCRPVPAVTAALAACALAAGLLAAPAQAESGSGARAVAQAEPSVTDGCLESVPEPGSTDPVEICWTLFRPEGATADNRVPMIVHSHGWGGSRTKDPAAFERWLGAGYGVLSFDQRGFGASGGQAHVENPRYEGHDVRRLVRMLSTLDWVQQDGPGDPRLGAIGGSYGGGYQFLGAFELLRRHGTPVFDALAPEITWFDLNQSLAPEDVVRTEWALALSAAAASTDALPPRVYKALAEGAATGTWPDGSVPGTEDMESFFRKNGPGWHVKQGRRLDIPVLLGQGTTDTLFNLQQGLANWHRALTPASKRRSIFVAYNGGHALPAVFPAGVAVTSDPCSEQLAGDSFADLARRFMDEQLKGRDTGLAGYGRIHLATPASTCTTVDSVAPSASYDVGLVATPTTGSAPLAYPVAEGPIRIAGTPRMVGKLTALGVQNRAFYGLAVGTTPADARLVQNNVLPLNEPGPVTGEKRRVALPSVAVDVPEGQTLYVLASAVSDTFVGMSSRTPGAVLLEDTKVKLPVVGR
ncbi:CocE/NonD family hydrolase [Nocardioides sp. GCM10027113]|uniref:CocE/NonD family hydrolase n=1 Tax=unclassified Nocardioides TaxID=2615069 RepID=UPI00360D9DC5